jgi:transposase InsO family protein
MPESNVGLELLKQSPSLSNSNAIVLSAGTSYDDLLVLNANLGLLGQSIWLVYGEEQTLYISKQESKQQNIASLLPAKFKKTHFAFYRQRLGDPRKDFPSVEGKRTAWIPVDGFFAGAWHDGPLVVTESDGSISNLIPTGTEATLVLAPDDTLAIGRDLIEALDLEGPLSHSIYRGCVAGVKQKLRLWSKETISISVSDSSLTTLVRLAILRTATLNGQRITVQLSANDDNAPQKIDPRFRRFCEHAGIAIDTWTEPLFDLETFCSWMNPRWTEDLIQVVNKHGDLIPI